jgi:hypothetical protein
MPFVAAGPSFVLSDGNFEDGSVPLAVAESSLPPDDGDVRLASAAVVLSDDNDDNDDFVDDEDDFDPNDLDQLLEADDEENDWGEDEEEETARPIRATEAASGDVLDQYTPDSLQSIDPNRVEPPI